MRAVLEILGAVIGGVFRLLPEVAKAFTAKRDADHEYRMTELQLRIDQARAGQALDLVHAQGAVAGDAAELQAWAEAVKGQGAPTGVRWVDALSATVRPVLTYWWCLVLYSAHKAVLIGVGLQDGLSLQQFAPLVLTPFDCSVVASIIGFWFTDRALRRK
jgi:hypothetical protein